MSTIPEPVQRFTNALKKRADVREAAVGLRPRRDGPATSDPSRRIRRPSARCPSPQRFRRGADQGDPACQAELGECYELGKGVEKNLAEALRWYQASLKNGLKAVQPAIDRVKNAMK